jgi:hypothetical protein
VDVYLVPLSSNYSKIASHFFKFISSNKYFLLVAGIILMSISILLYTIACYHRRSFNKKRILDSNGVFNMGKSLNKVAGFHRYSEIPDDNIDEDDEEQSHSSSGLDGKKLKNTNSKSNSNKYSKFSFDNNKNNKKSMDSRRLLFTDDDDDEDENDDKVFVR